MDEKETPNLDVSDDVDESDSVQAAIADMKKKVQESIPNGDDSNGDHKMDVACENDDTNGAVSERDEEEQVEEQGEDEEQEEIEEIEVEEKKVNGALSPEKSSRRKSPLKVREVDEIVESDDDDNDVEEIKDDGDSDSDIMEVDAEDPLAAVHPTQNKSSTPNVVTIDDLTMLHKLANSAKVQQADSCKLSFAVVDTSTILAGKATSGVTITPAKPKTAVPAILGLPSGVTISTSSKGISLRAVSASNSAFGYDQKGQLNDPNLTDDTFVVEAPSFIVPYVYEKPPKETFDAFRSTVKKLVEEKALDKNEKAKRDDLEDDSKDTSGDKDDNKDTSNDDEEIVVVDNYTNEPKQRPPSDNYFDSSLGKFLFDLGMNMVQETVQADLLKQQIRKSQKDKSAGVMHAIMSLKKNLESSKEHNEPFHFKERKCRFCSFRTESDLCMQHHLETPHMKQLMYRCNFCPYETKSPQEVLGHMSTAHGIRGSLERAPGAHQCPQCPFEDMKGKLSRHKNSCDKRFRPERNQEPANDWEPPAKIPKPPVLARRPGQVMSGHPMGASQALSQLANFRQFLPSHQKQGNIYATMPSLQMGQAGRGKSLGTYKADLKLPNALSMARPGMAFNKASQQMFNLPGGNFLNNQVVLKALNQPTNKFPVGSKMQPNLGSNSVTIQNISQRSGSTNSRFNASPSISITPVPGRSPMTPKGSPAAKSSSSALKPGQPSPVGTQVGKGSFVICEICDGYIKDLEQLRNHMLWIHKVKIHPKMIYNRPPLNCQKCQFRFFTDQGLERHLLGSHGLVTACMQELANKGQDSGRCPICGKVYQWKLLNHVAKDHQKTLKPAHLSYKCTVCSATFGQYKLFEKHVYQAHSGAAKKAGKVKQQTNAPLVGKPPIKMSSAITIIPKPAEKPTISSPTKSVPAGSEQDVIELDDEGEMDNLEQGTKQTGSKRPLSSGKNHSEPSNRKMSKEESDEDGIEEIEDEDPDE